MLRQGFEPERKIHMKKEVHMKARFPKWIWGTFLLLAAVFVLSNQFGGFVEIGVGSIIVAVLALALAVQCIAHLTFAPLPIPLAVLYIIFQEPLELPYFQTWTLILAAVLSTIGLFILLPRKHKHSKWVHYVGEHQSMQPEDGGSDNNPSVSVSFGGTSRYLHSDCLETVKLHCNFGSLEIYFDQAKLSPNGAEVNIDCSFGGIVLFIPKQWTVIEKMNSTLGGVEINNRYAAPSENSPQLTVTGSVTLGGVEIRYV
jgi:predicted membrane protein